MQAKNSQMPAIRPQRAYTREAAIGPNKPARFHAEFLLFGLILAHLLIKSHLQPRFLSRCQSRKQITGDVRHGSIKRVTSAVGEGSIAIELVHQYLDRF